MATEEHPTWSPSSGSRHAHQGSASTARTGRLAARNLGRSGRQRAKDHHPGRSAEHSENISRNARKGTRLMVKGTAGDEGSGIDIEATSLAFDPSHDEPEKQ